MYELIYSSFASPGLSDDDIAGMLNKAQELNAKNNISPVGEKTRNRAFGVAISS